MTDADKHDSHLDHVAEATKLGVPVGEVVAHRITEEDLLRQSRASLTIYSWTGLRICGLMVVMGLNQAGYGVDWGVIGGINAFDRWHAYYGFPTAGVIISTINALMQIGTFVGAPFLALSDVVGRRGINFAGNFLTVVGAFMQGAAPNLATLMAGRLILGFGTALCTAPQYVAEVAPVHLRGRIVGVFGACFQVGSLLMLGVMMVLTRWESDWQWRIAFMIQAIFPGLVCVLIYVLCPESPRYLVMKGKVQKAREVIARYQTTHNDIDDPIVGMVVSQIEESLENSRETLKASYDFRVFFTRGVGFRTGLLLIYSVFQQWNGGGIIGRLRTNPSSLDTDRPRLLPHSRPRNSRHNRHSPPTRHQPRLNRPLLRLHARRRLHCRQVPPPHPHLHGHRAHRALPDGRHHHQLAVRRQTLRG